MVQADVEVLLTGFGSFEEIVTNPSTLIVQLLVDHVEHLKDRDIRIHVYPNPIIVVYEDVYKLVPDLVKDYPNVEYFIHVGVHQEATNFRIERRARHGPYERKDVLGHSFSEENDSKWHSLPDELFTPIDAQSLVETVKADVKIDRIETSEDAGLFLCEFIFYNSLFQTQLLRKTTGIPANSLFFHVPTGLSSGEIEQGRDILLSIIRALVSGDSKTKL